MAVHAQNSKDYLVYTKNATKAVTESSASGTDSVEVKAKPRDFISANFVYKSLCDWDENDTTLKFMVVPEKYDLIVKTFHNANTKEEVSSVTLRHKIMVYKGHSVTPEGHGRINFHCIDDNTDYYYEIPNGSFEDYCYNKMGVPTLAYLGDVDIAREKLVGKKVYTKTRLYRVDLAEGNEKYEVVSINDRQEVTIVAAGVGTRSFPVKIIVEDENGKQFYQNVAISKTNCGMRDDEFSTDNVAFLFGNSFELEDDIMMLSDNYHDYIGQTVHTRYLTKMLNEKQTRNVNIISQTGFKIMEIHPLPQKGLMSLVLKNTTTSGLYYKTVRFASEYKPGEEKVEGEELFGKLFALGEGRQIETSTATRTAIREGRVTIGMTEDEVLMVMGDVESESVNKAGNKIWRCLTPGTGKTLVIEFGPDAKVKSTDIDRTVPPKTNKTTGKKKVASKSNSSKRDSWQDRNGTPL